jgi:hypothetical protein
VIGLGFACAQYVILKHKRKPKNVLTVIVLTDCQLGRAGRFPFATERERLRDDFDPVHALNEYLHVNPLSLSQGER